MKMKLLIFRCMQRLMVLMFLYHGARAMEEKQQASSSSTISGFLQKLDNAVPGIEFLLALFLFLGELQSG